MHEKRGLKPSQIAKELGGTCTEWTVRRALKEVRAKMEKEQENVAG
jgi:DNA-directed RNA polymerase specialized sigma24 family protein